MASEQLRGSGGDRSLPDLLGSVLGQVSTLFRQEVRLARAEIGEKISHMSGAAVPLAAGGGLLLGAVVILLLAAVSALTAFDVDAGWAQLIVGVVAAGIGYLMIRGGIARLSASNLMPNRTADQLSRDAQLAKEQVQ